MKLQKTICATVSRAQETLFSIRCRITAKVLEQFNTLDFLIKLFFPISCRDKDKKLKNCTFFPRWRLERNLSGTDFDGTFSMSNRKPQ